MQQSGSEPALESQKMKGGDKREHGHREPEDAAVFAFHIGESGVSGTGEAWFVILL